MSLRLVATKTLAALQTLLGAFTIAYAGTLAANKTYTQELTPGYHLPGSANNEVESVLLYLGLAIITCGFIQGLTGIKSGWLQVVYGLGVTIVADFLVNSQNAVDYYLSSPIYYLAFIPLALGIVVFATGLVQLMKKWVMAVIRLRI